MADDVAITAGSGTAIATDDVSGRHFQRMKLSDGTADSTTEVRTGSGGKTNALRAVLANDEALPAGTNVIGGVSGDVAHDAGDSGSPVKQGAVAIAHGTNPTPVAAADRTNLYANRAGVPFVMGGHPNIQTFRTQFTSAQTDVALVSVSSGLKIVLTALMITLDNASTVFPSARVGFGATNTPTGAGVVAAHGGLPAGGGLARGDGSGILGVGGDGEDLRITTVGAATGNGVEVVGSYYTIES